MTFSAHGTAPSAALRSSALAVSVPTPWAARGTVTSALCPPAPLHQVCRCRQSEAAVLRSRDQYWPILAQYSDHVTHQRQVFRSRDLCWPILAQYSGHVISIDPWEPSIQVTWSVLTNSSPVFRPVLTNQRPVFRSRDQYWPILAQYSGQSLDQYWPMRAQYSGHVTNKRLI